MASHGESNPKRLKYGRLTLRGRNLADKDYVAWADIFYPDQVLLGSPRSVELVFSAKF